MMSGVVVETSQRHEEAAKQEAVTAEAVPDQNIRIFKYRGKLLRIDVVLVQIGTL